MEKKVESFYDFTIVYDYIEETSIKNKNILKKCNKKFRVLQPPSEAYEKMYIATKVDGFKKWQLQTIFKPIFFEADEDFMDYLVAFQFNQWSEILEDCDVDIQAIKVFGKGIRFEWGCKEFLNNNK